MPPAHTIAPSGPVDATTLLVLSLSNNALCGLSETFDRRGNRRVVGTYTAEGIIQITEALKVNKTLQSIEYTVESNQSTVLPVRARWCHSATILACLQCLIQIH